MALATPCREKRHKECNPIRTKCPVNCPQRTPFQVPSFDLIFSRRAGPRLPNEAKFKKLVQMPAGRPVIHPQRGSILARLGIALRREPFQPDRSDLLSSARTAAPSACRAALRVAVNGEVSGKAHRTHISAPETPYFMAASPRVLIPKPRPSTSFVPPNAN